MTEPVREPAEREPAAELERLALYQDDPTLRRRRGRSGLIGVAIVAAAIGGVTGLLGGELVGLAAAAIVSVPLLYVVLFTLRRRLWLEGNTILVKAWRTRRMDLVAARRIDLLITDVRGTRTVSLLVNAGERGKAVKIDLALYSGTGAHGALGVLQLRRLANALMNNIEANGMVFAELLVAQLKAEARGDTATNRPLYRLASAALPGKLVQRFTMEAVSRFVATLE